MSAYKRLRVLYFVVSFLLSFALLSVHLSALSVSARSAILIDANSGTVLYGKNYSERLPMASTTKIMTAVVAVENMELGTRIKIPREAVGVEGSSVYLCEGEMLTLEELLYALLLSSANDAAVAIAIAVGGNVGDFVDMMNERAERLGLEDTHFENPHGLDGDTHYTTANDLALLTAYALSIPKLREIVSTYKKSISFNNEAAGRVLINHNKLLKSYRDVIGVKTGFTKKSGRCLVTAAERDGALLVAVTLNAPNDWKDHASMLDYGFENYQSVVLGGLLIEVPVISGTCDTVSCIIEETRMLLSKDMGQIECRMEMYFVAYAPVKLGEIIGKAFYICDGEEICSVNIVAIESIGLCEQNYTIWNRIANKIKGSNK